MKNQEIYNKVAIVTGSSMGIGKAIAVELAANGARVVLNGRDQAKLQEAEAELIFKGAEVIAVQADVRYPEDCRKLIASAVEAFGQIDILVNNAAISARGSIEDMIPEVFAEVMNTDFGGSVFPTKYALPYLKKNRGHIIFINSVAGFFGIPYNAVYSCAKIAQATLADALRIELAETGIHVGVAFVSFTRNDPRKKVLNPDGQWVFLPARSNVSLVTPQYVAIRILRMINCRKPRIILSRMGKISYFLQRIFPFFVRFVFNLRRKKIQEEYTNIGGKLVSDITAVHEEV